MLRNLALGVFGVGAGFLLAGCPDHVEYDGLYITNVTDAPIKAFLVRPDASTDLLTEVSRDGENQVSRLYRLDTNGDDCTDFPISIRQRGEEIERFEPPVCWDDGYEILAVREPQG